MQLSRIKNGWKPITIAIGLAAVSHISLYAEVDNYSKVRTVINNHITNNYIQEVNNFSDEGINDLAKFKAYHSAWVEETCFSSSIQKIIENDNFIGIVAMGYRAVPFIINEIEANPSTLVWALNEIYQKKISDNPKTTITDACRLWVKEIRTL